MHHKYERAQVIIDAVPHSGVVFLGDYWDDYGDTPEQARETAIRVRKRVEEHPEDEFILGNHDLGYLFGPNFRCDGFSIAKYFAIRDVLGSVQSFRKHFTMHTWVDGWLLTHAGLRRGMIHATKDINRDMADCLRQMEAGSQHRFLWPPGIVWCRDFQPIRGLKQLFGHTQRGEPRRYDDDNWCIDTGMNHYALIQDGVLTVLPFGNLVTL